jgi:hypothetical protein
MRLQPENVQNVRKLVENFQKKVGKFGKFSEKFCEGFPDFSDFRKSEKI